MNCDKARGLILTDYIDGNMDKGLEKSFRDHLSRCQDCREYLAAVEKDAVEPFLKAGTVTPPDYLWHRIKQAIYTEKAGRTAFEPGILTRIREFLYVRRPAFVIASALIIVLVAGGLATFKISSNFARSAAIGRVDYIRSLTETPSGAGTEGFGTSIEEFFL